MPMKYNYINLFITISFDPIFDILHFSVDVNRFDVSTVIWKK